MRRGGLPKWSKDGDRALRTSTRVGSTARKAGVIDEGVRSDERVLEMMVVEDKVCLR